MVVDEYVPQAAANSISWGVGDVWAGRNISAWPFAGDVSLGTRGIARRFYGGRARVVTSVPGEPHVAGVSLNPADERGV